MGAGQSVELGNVSAMVELATCHLDGLGVPKNIELGLSLLEEAAERQEPVAMYNLAQCLSTGTYTKEDISRAYDLLLQSEKRGFVRAQGTLGYRLYNGDKFPLDKESGVQWFYKAASAGDAVSQYNYGQHLFSVGDYQEAIPWLQKAADQQYPHAQSLLGRCYLEQLGVPQNNATGVSWIKKAALQSNVQAMAQLANCYSNGIGVEQNHREAVIWFRKAADLGSYSSVQSQIALATLVVTGQLDAREVDDAIELLHQLANEGGSPMAQAVLGACHCEGIALVPDTESAAQWLRRAAEQGYSDAQNALGIMLWRGEGIPQDYEQAAMWFEHAAENGHSEAQLHFALSIKHGYRANSNHSFDYWIQKSAATGNSAAKEYLSSISVSVHSASPTPATKNELDPPFSLTQALSQIKKNILTMHSIHPEIASQ